MESALENLENRIFPNGKKAWVALAQDDWVELEHLIDTGKVNPNEMFPFNLSGFVESVKNGLNDHYYDLYLTSLKQMLADGNILNITSIMISLNSEFDPDEPTSILMMACIFGQIDIVRMLIEKGADLHYRTPYEDLSALHYAVATPFRNLEVISILVDPPTQNHGLDFTDSESAYGNVCDLAIKLLTSVDYRSLVIKCYTRYPPDNTDNLFN